MEYHIFYLCTYSMDIIDVSWSDKSLNIGFFADTVQVRSFKLCFIHNLALGLLNQNMSHDFDLVSRPQVCRKQTANSVGFFFSLLVQCSCCWLAFWAQSTTKDYIWAESSPASRKHFMVVTYIEQIMHNKLLLWCVFKGDSYNIGCFALESSELRVIWT